MYSMVNQVMQTASIMARCALSTGWPLASLSMMLGIVLSVMPIVETTMNVMEMTLTT